MPKDTFPGEKETHEEKNGHGTGRAVMAGIAKAAAFVVIFAVLFIHVSYILRPYAGSASRKNLCGFYAEKKNSLDIVLIGSSAVFSFWEPMEFWEKYGVTSYNFATGIMVPQMFRHEIDEVLRMQDPKLIILDMRPFSVAEDGYYLQPEVANMDHEVPLRNSVDNMKYSLNRVRTIQEEVPEGKDALPYHFDLIKYHTEWDRLADRQSLLFFRNEAADFARGFKLVDDMVPVNYPDRTKDGHRKALTPRLEKIYRDLLDYCRDKDLQVLLLVNEYCQYENEKGYFNFMSDIAEEYGIPFFNTNDVYQEVGMDFETDYYDGSHTNILGADKYTDFIGRYLMEHYSFEDHRKDPAYASWTENEARWDAESDALRASLQERAAGAGQQ